MVQVALMYRKIRYGYKFRRIPLTQGKYAMVDPDDYERLNKYKWQARRKERSFYATRSGWCERRGKRKIITMHRQVLPVPEGMFVDHINHNGLDNRKANLRPATQTQNTYNRRRHRNKTSSKYKGIYWEKRSKKWLVIMQHDFKRIKLGRFDDEEEAARAYDSAARIYQCEYAELNFKETQGSRCKTLLDVWRRLWYRIRRRS